MKKYLFFFFLCLFSFSFGIVFAEDNLIAQSTAIKAGNLTFQIPAGFQPSDMLTPSSSFMMYVRKTGEYSSESITINVSKNLSSDNESYIKMKEYISKTFDKFEELNINGKKVILSQNVGNENALFYENGFSYHIVFRNMNKEYEYGKSFLINIIRTAR